MRFKYLLAALAFFSCTFSYTTFAETAANTTQVIIKTELSSPVVLENPQGENYLKVSLTGFKQEQVEKTPINVALVIDRSGSMSGSRIEKAREAAIMAINMLDNDDIVSVVIFDDEVRVIIPATKANNKAEMIKIIKDTVKGGMNPA